MLSAFAQLCPAQSGTSSVPKTNPGRLTVSTPTTLIRLDTGSSRMSRSSQNTRQSLPSASGSAKSLDVRTSRLALFLQSEPLAISLSGDQTAVHEGEVFAGVQGVLLRSAHFGTNEILPAGLGRYTSSAVRTNTVIPILWGSSQFPERYGISHQPFAKGNTVGSLRPGSRGPRNI